LRLIKAGIQLALLAVAANATWHVFLAYSAHYKVRDAARTIAQNRGDKTDAQVHDEIMAVADEADVPLPPEALVVTHDGLASAVSASYSRPLEVLPNHPITWSFSFHVDTFTLQPGGPPGSPK
jgi:hypothetical protein